MAAPGVVVGVYRHDAARRMLDLVPAGWPAAFWALDRVAGVAADRTVGSGPGAKFAHCNALLAALDPAPEQWVVVVDDDVLVPAGLAELVRLSEVAGFGLAQPAHVRGSHTSHPITMRHRLCRARWTTYVEIGPVFAVAPEWRPRILPFPGEMGMGWGLELLWMDLQSSGLRLGVVDEVGMDHVVPPGRSYDLSPEGRRVETMLRERGVVSLGDLQRTRARWWRWQRRPSWT